MRLDTSQQMRQEMRMKLAPRMIQSMEILQLPIMALQERINQELEENVTLVENDGQEEDLPESESAESAEVPEPKESGSGEPAESEEGDSEEIEVQELIVGESDNHEEDFSRLEMLEEQEDWNEHFEGPHRPSRSAIDELAERKHDAMQNQPCRPQTLQDYLYQQFSFLDCSPEVRELGTFIIYNLDDNGYLHSSLEEIVQDFGNGVTLKQAAEALRLIHKLDPPGVGARDLRECLLLQVTPQTPLAHVVRTLIANHLPDIEQNRLPLIERRTGFTIEEIKRAIEVLRTLNPKPGRDFAVQNVPTVTPDLSVEEAPDGSYRVRLEDEHLPSLHISRRYIQMLRDRNTDPKVREFIQRKIQSARWLIESIEQRRNTITRVAQAIIDHQREFLDKGPGYIQPLKMQEIADRVKVHVTTVSRAVDDKWIQTPRGIFPLKRFFGGGTRTDSGDEVAWEIVQKKLSEVIDNEDKRNPLSDDEIVRKLAEQGFHIARRTVTKYRKKMGIPSSRQRKQF